LGVVTGVAILGEYGSNSLLKEFKLLRREICGSLHTAGNKQEESDPDHIQRTSYLEMLSHAALVANEDRLTRPPAGSANRKVNFA
jgi:hypothetical protein